MKIGSRDVRPDHWAVCRMVKPQSTVLDLGCGTGDLLDLLVKERNVKGQGIEWQEESIYQCVEKGLTVLHGDIETGLGDFPSASFDYVILNQSMQEVRNVEFVLAEALRVGRQAIVGFPNFCHWRARLDLFFKGQTPVSRALPYRWNNTPNLHYLSMKDFEVFCDEKKINVIQSLGLTAQGQAPFLHNLLSETVVFQIEKDL